MSEANQQALLDNLINAYERSHTEEADHAGQEMIRDRAHAARLYAAGSTLTDIQAVLSYRGWSEQEVALQIGTVATWLRTADHAGEISLREMRGL